MIEKMHIKNFQSHADSVLEFVPGVNAIVGDSHVGKSAIRRVLRWMNGNRPLSNSFIKIGTEEAYVRVEFDNGAVSRTKSKKKNQYEVDGNPEPHTAFGSGVPEEVTDLVNMTDVNVQTQHGPFFLVFDTPGAVATYLRSVIGLDELSEVSSDINTRLRAAKVKLAAEGGELEEIQEKLDELDEVPIVRLEECIEEYRQLFERNESLSRDVGLLSKMIKKIEELSSYSQICEKTVNRLFRTVDVLVVHGECLTEEHRSLSSILSRLDALSGEAVAVRDGLLDEVEEALASYLENAEDEIVIGQKIKRLVDMFRDALQDDEELRDAQAEEHQLLCQLKRCPSCGSVMTDEARAYLIGDER